MSLCNGCFVDLDINMIKVRGQINVVIDFDGIGTQDQDGQ